MLKNISVYKGSNPVPVCYEEPNECPMCHTIIEPIALHEILTTYDDGEESILSLLHFCNKCRRTFLTTYHVIKDDSFFHEKRCFKTELIQSVPFTPVSKNFSDVITGVSPKFVDIYNQAYQAEQLGLSDICGMGYRKALEFLMKDYLISKNPDHSEVIENKPLSQCIPLLNDPRLEVVSKTAVWLGNDETHFVKKHMDYNIKDLKRFIHATVSFMELMADFDEATAIQPKK